MPLAQARHALLKLPAPRFDQCGPVFELEPLSKAALELAIGSLMGTTSFGRARGGRLERRLRRAQLPVGGCEPRHGSVVLGGEALRLGARRGEPLVELGGGPGALQTAHAGSLQALAPNGFVAEQALALGTGASNL